MFEPPDEASEFTTDLSLDEPPTKRYVPLDRFHMNRKLFDSLMGQVNLATDIATGELVAVKLSSRKHVEAGVSLKGNKIMEDVRGEIEFLQKLTDLSHSDGGPGSDGFPRLIGHGEDDKLLWAVMEFANGGEVFNAMGQLGDARSVFKQICEAVKFLHKNNIAHRDMSLENVLLHEENGKTTIKIIDFGLSIKMEKDQQINDGKFVGKAVYASPQLFSAKNGSSYNPFASDIFALGIMLVRLIFSRDLLQLGNFSNLRFGKVGVHQLFKSMKRPSTVPFPDDALVDLVTGMLSYDEEDRLTIAQVVAHRYFTKS